MGTLTCQQERLLYSFFNADSIIDYLRFIGVRPFVELSFMPETLSSGTPRNHGDWATLVGKLVPHWVDRYGIAEVRSWFFYRPGCQGHRP